MRFLFPEVGSVPASSITGLIPLQVLFGSGLGGVEQSDNFQFDTALGAIFTATVADEANGYNLVLVPGKGGNATLNPAGQAGVGAVFGGEGGDCSATQQGGQGREGAVKGGKGGAGSLTQPSGQGGPAYILGGDPGDANGGPGNYGGSAIVDSWPSNGTITANNSVFFGVFFADFVNVGRVGKLTTVAGAHTIDERSTQGAGQTWRRTAVIGDYVVADYDFYISVVATPVPSFITLPPLASVPEGTPYKIKDASGGAGANNITILGNGGEFIDDATSFVIDQDYTCVSLINDGVLWSIMSVYTPQVNANKITGLTPDQVIWGNALGGVGQDSGLTYEAALSRFRAISGGATLEVDGNAAAISIGSVFIDILAAANPGAYVNINALGKQLLLNSTSALLTNNGGSSVEVGSSGGGTEVVGTLRELGQVSEAQTTLASTSILPAQLANYFFVTGVTTVNFINTVGYTDGTEIDLKFTGLLTVTHNAGAATATEAPILLNGSVNLSTLAGNSLSLRLGTIAGVQAWRQLAPAALVA